MDSKRNISQVFNSNPQGSWLRGRPENKLWKCVQTDINNSKLKNGKGGQETELMGRSPLRRQRTAPDWVQHGRSILHLYWF
jgi:hypothetical protein